MPKLTEDQVKDLSVQLQDYFAVKGDDYLVVFGASDILKIVKKIIDGGKNG